MNMNTWEFHDAGCGKGYISYGNLGMSYGYRKLDLKKDNDI